MRLYLQVRPFADVAVSLGNELTGELSRWKELHPRRGRTADQAFRLAVQAALAAP